jgi:hypothetical protein
MYKCNPAPAPIVKGTKFRNFQCHINQYEIDEMKAVTYAFIIGSLMYAQVCIRHNLAFVTGCLTDIRKILVNVTRKELRKPYDIYKALNASC